MRPAPDGPALGRRAEVLALLTADTPPALATGLSEGAWRARLETLGSRLHPWLAHRLARLGMEQALPPRIREHLQAATRASAVAELRRRHALVEITDAFDSAGIPFVLLKGMALAYTHYPTPDLRTMSDIDLWLPRARLAAAVPALAQMNWQIPARYATHSRKEGDALLLERQGMPFVLEVHSWPPSLGRDISAAEAIWSRCEYSSIAGRRVRVCATRDLITHLCIHLARKHGCSDGLRGLLDLATVARTLKDEATWRAMGDGHREDGVAVWTTFVLAMARDILAVAVPDAYFRAAGTTSLPHGLVATATEQLWDREPTTVRGFDGMIAGEAGGTLSALRSYARLYYAAPGADGRAWWRALPSRLQYDLSVRIPRYWRSFRRGEWRRDRLAHRAQMIRDRNALVAALDRAASDLSDA